MISLWNALLYIMTTQMKIEVHTQTCIYTWLFEMKRCRMKIIRTIKLNTFRLYVFSYHSFGNDDTNKINTSSKYYNGIFLLEIEKQANGAFTYTETVNIEDDTVVINLNSLLLYPWLFTTTQWLLHFVDCLNFFCETGRKNKKKI